MSQTYQARRRAQGAPAEKYETSVPGPSMRELAAGAVPSTEQMGCRVDLPDAIREKMESSFGADFSNVRLYESQTVADAGAQAMTMGSNVAFAPGQLDLTSTSGQALLGHELSHVVSQARGESAGRGFLADSGLESQADRQGMMAARGESVYAGPVAPMSASAVPASAGGVAQAAKKSTIASNAERKHRDIRYGDSDSLNAAYDRYAQANQMANRGAVRTALGPYEGYAAAAMDGRSEEEQDEILRIFASGDRKQINGRIGADMRSLRHRLHDYSSGLVSEDFKTRAGTYVDAARDSRRASQLESLLDDKELGLTEGEDMLDEKSVQRFRHTHGNFKSDLNTMYDSLISAQDWSSPFHSRQRKDYRKDYRRARRHGVSASEADKRVTAYHFGFPEEETEEDFDALLKKHGIKFSS